ncbi:MAG TPA: VOC family protein [Planctomycetota bacterium]|nr:VOC family protein [Planctomycetota bacterium]
MTDHHHHRDAVDGHADLHSEQGPRRGEHSGRSANPTIKVTDLAWLEFEKPDLSRAETFARDFGFVVAARDVDALYLRGSLPGTPCLVIRKGPRTRFVGSTFKAADEADLHRLAEAVGRRVETLDDPTQGKVVRLVDPSDFPVGVVYTQQDLGRLPERQPHIVNFGTDLHRFNATQRPPSEPAQVQRLGHLVLATPHFLRSLNWYLDALGLIVSDFQYVPGQRDRGPALAFTRCDRGTIPSDHHTLALHLGPVASYSHSAYQVTDFDAVAAGGEYLLGRGYERAWGIGRHFQGSQIFDYWRDPDKLMVEHFTDGDLFDNTLDPGWAPLTASGLSQWGPPVNKKFLGANPSPRLVRDVITALRQDNEIDLSRLIGMTKGMNQ